MMANLPQLKLTTLSAQLRQGAINVWSTSMQSLRVHWHCLHMHELLKRTFDWTEHCHLFVFVSFITRWIFQSTSRN
jgi:hypothetical protein